MRIAPNETLAYDLVETFDELRMRVAEKQWPVGHDVVDVPAAGFVERIGAARSCLHEHRHAGTPTRAHRRIATAGEHVERAFGRPLHVHTLARFAGSMKSPCPKR
jgi:hypothetical protein